MSSCRFSKKTNQRICFFWLEELLRSKVKHRSFVFLENLIFHIKWSPVFEINWPLVFASMRKLPMSSLCLCIYICLIYLTGKFFKHRICITEFQFYSRYQTVSIFNQKLWTTFMTAQKIATQDYEAPTAVCSLKSIVIQIKESTYRVSFKFSRGGYKIRNVFA